MRSQSQSLTDFDLRSGSRSTSKVCIPSRVAAALTEASDGPWPSVTRNDEFCNTSKALWLPDESASIANVQTAQHLKDSPAIHLFPGWCELLLRYSLRPFMKSNGVTWNSQRSLLFGIEEIKLFQTLDESCHWPNLPHASACCIAGRCLWLSVRRQTVEKVGVLIPPYQEHTSLNRMQWLLLKAVMLLLSLHETDLCFSLTHPLSLMWYYRLIWKQFVQYNKCFISLRTS